jgi:hypothetical protein
MPTPTTHITPNTNNRIATQSTVGNAGLAGAKYVTKSQDHKPKIKKQNTTSHSKREYMHGLA